MTIRPTLRLGQGSIVGLGSIGWLAFAGSVAALLGAFDLGSFVPRLVTPDGVREPQTCEWCSVSQACVRGDSATRRRLLRFVERARSGKREDLGDAERALVAVFDLGRVER